MKLLVLIAIGWIAVNAQRVNLIDGIQFSWPRSTQQPQSERMVYRPYSFRTAATALSAGVATSNEVLFVEGQNLLGGAVRVALMPPSGGPCEGMLAADPLPDCASDGTKSLATACVLVQDIGSANANKLTFFIPVSTITQGSLRYADRLCIAGDSRTGATFVDTSFLYQVFIPCLAGSNGGATSAGTATDIVVTEVGGAITNIVFPDSCVATSTVTLSTNVQAETFRTQVREESVSLTSTTSQIDWDIADRRSRVHCCGWRNSGVLDTQNGNASMERRTGICFDPNVQTCCSGQNDNRKQIGPAPLLINAAGTGKLVNKFTEKCCYGGLYNALSDSVLATLNTRTGGIAPLIRPWDAQCPCLSNPVTNYCNSYEACCQPTKFPEFAALTATYGSCYDPRRQGCCSTGQVFNSGTQQCCKISGVQSLDIPCPCANDAHCDLNQACCRQFNPPQAELQLEAASCNIYTNYLAGLLPTGGFGQDTWARGNGINNRCLGQCLDTRFSICCNGNPCIGAYERCCNETCCNKVTQSCVMGQKRPTGNAFNGRDVRVFYELCTTTEALLPLQAVVAFFVPIMLLFVTFMGLAFTLYFSKKQNALNPLSAYEKAIATLSLLVILFAWPLFFSPLYKYGVIAIWISFFSILSATCGVKRLLPVALILQVVLLIYIFDPFAGNEILNLSYTRRESALFVNSADSGLFLSIMGLWRAEGGAFPGQRCAAFYAGWFVRDPLVEDQARLESGGDKTTYGYCSREFIATLMIVEILMSMWVIILTVVTLVTFIKNVLIGKVVKQNPFHM